QREVGSEEVLSRINRRGNSPHGHVSRPDSWTAYVFREQWCAAGPNRLCHQALGGIARWSAIRDPARDSFQVPALAFARYRTGRAQAIRLRMAQSVPPDSAKPIARIRRRPSAGAGIEG